MIKIINNKVDVKVSNQLELIEDVTAIVLSLHKLIEGSEITNFFTDVKDSFEDNEKDLQSQANRIIELLNIMQDNSQKLKKLYSELDSELGKLKNESEVSDD